MGDAIIRIVVEEDGDKERTEKLFSVLEYAISDKPKLLRYLISISEHEGFLTICLNDEVGWDFAISRIEMAFKTAWTTIWGYKKEPQVKIEYVKVSK